MTKFNSVASMYRSTRLWFQIDIPGSIDVVPTIVLRISNRSDNRNVHWENSITGNYTGSYLSCLSNIVYVIALFGIGLMLSNNVQNETQNNWIVIPYNQSGIRRLHPLSQFRSLLLIVFPLQLYHSQPNQTISMS